MYKQKAIKITVSDEDLELVQERLQSVGVTLPEMVQTFISDLSDSFGGSDESMFANEWFNRNYGF